MACWKGNVQMVFVDILPTHRAALFLDSPWHTWARFGGTGSLFYLCISRKRKSAGCSSFRVFRANYLI